LLLLFESSALSACAQQAAASELARNRVFPTRLHFIPDSLVAFGQLGTSRP